MPATAPALENEDVAAIFDTLADLLEIQGDNPFRVRAYRSAARTIRDLPHRLEVLVAEGADLVELPAIGRDLAAKIVEILETGRLTALEEARSRTPPALAELMELPGLGPKRARLLHDELNIDSLEVLAAAVRAGRLRGLHGFGAKTEHHLLEELERRRTPERPLTLHAAELAARPLLEHMRAAPGVAEAAVAGSFRRRREVVRDLDLLVACEDSRSITERFLSYEDVAETIAAGTTRSTVRLRSGLQVDLRVVAPESYGAALHYFTGSKAHNIAVRRIAQRAGLKLNEYGVFRGEDRIGGRSEDEVFAAVGLPYIEPELRENRGEIEAALEGRLPSLVAPGDIRGDLHVHVNGASLEDLAEWAEARGYEYLAVADRGLGPRRLAARIDEIERLNERLERVTLLTSAEIDIREDGSLDLPERLLRRLDLTICALHTGFDLSRDRQTERVLRAMESRYFTVLAHPSGRIINEPEPYALDLERVTEAARDRGCFLELDAQPSRLDLDDVHCRLAKELGVKLAISTEARSRAELDYMGLGVAQARRGWLEPEDVLNSYSLRELRSLLDAARR
jgi:DNA polymerase (family 10)